MNEKTDSGKKRPNYGIVLLPVLQMLIRFANTSLILTIAYGLIFLPFSDGSRHYLCLAYLSLMNGFFMPLMFVFFIYHISLSSVFMEYNAKEFVKELDLKGDEKVFSLCVFRGSTFVQIAKQLTKGGTLHVADPWNTKKIQMSSEWLEENCRREGIPPERYSIQYGEPCNLPYASGEFDVVISNFTAASLQDDDHNEHIGAELFRILKPGGRLIFKRLFSEDDIEKKAVSLGLEVKVKFMFRFPSPAKIATGVKKIISMEVANGRDTKRKHSCSKAYPRLVAPDYSSWAPIVTLIISTIILAGFSYLIWWAFPLTDVPEGIPQRNMNRLNIFLAQCLPTLGFAMILNYVQMASELASGELSRDIGSIAWFYIKFLLLGVFVSTIWNGIFWSPSVLLDLYLIPYLHGIPVFIPNLFLTWCLLYMIYRIKGLHAAFQKKKKESIEEKEVPEEEEGLLSNEVIQ